MEVYKALSLQELLSKDILMKQMDNIKNISIDLIPTTGFSGSKMYKLKLESGNDKKNLYLKVNNLKEDWLASVSNDKGRELIIFKENIYSKVKEFVDDIYIGYYISDDTYAILMNDVSEYIGSKNNMNNYYEYLDNLAKFHAKFRECDVIQYRELLRIGDYYNFLSISKVDMLEEFKYANTIGWKRIREILGEDLYKKYNSAISKEKIEKFYAYYPTTFIHGDYRPDNSVYLDENNIKMIDFANCGCGPCTLDLFWYIISSVESSFDKIDLIYFYKDRLKKYMKYDYTEKTWTTLLEVGILCACRMYLAHFIYDVNMDNNEDLINMDWWIDSLKFILNNRL